MLPADGYVFVPAPRSLVVVFLQQVTADLAFGDLTQSDNSRLIVLFSYRRLSAFGRQLTGTLGSQHHQLEAVINVFQTIFNGNSCHNFPENKND